METMLLTRKAAVAADKVKGTAADVLESFPEIRVLVLKHTPRVLPSLSVHSLEDGPYGLLKRGFNVKARFAFLGALTDVTDLAKVFGPDKAWSLGIDRHGNLYFCPASFFDPFDAAPCLWEGKGDDEIKRAWDALLEIRKGFDQPEAPAIASTSGLASSPT